MNTFRSIDELIKTLDREKMLLKLKAAQAAGIAKAITFEFSHFMSPNSCYQAARHLFNRYCEHFHLPELNQ